MAGHIAFDLGLKAGHAGATSHQVSDFLARPAFRPRALFERFRIEVIATTETCEKVIDFLRREIQSAHRLFFSIEEIRVDRLDKFLPVDHVNGDASDFPSEALEVANY